MLCDSADVGGALCICELDGGSQLAPIHIAVVSRKRSILFASYSPSERMMPSMRSSQASSSPLLRQNLISQSLSEGAPSRGKRLLDCKFFTGEQEQLGTAVIADLCAGKGILIVVFGEGLTVVYLGQLVEGICR